MRVSPLGHSFQQCGPQQKVVNTCAVMHCGYKEDYTSIVVPCDVDPEEYTQEFCIMPMCAHHFNQLGAGFTAELSKEAILVSPEPNKLC